jgi:arginine exporter protein ArgO
MDEVRHKKWSTGVKRTGTVVAIALVCCYLATVIPLAIIGVDTLTWPTSIIVAMMFLYPILFFFMGMAVVWKKKFFPITHSNEVPEDKKDTNNIKTQID